MWRYFSFYFFTLLLQHILETHQMCLFCAKSHPADWIITQEKYWYQDCLFLMLVLIVWFNSSAQDVCFLFLSVKKLKWLIDDKMLLKLTESVSSHHSRHILSCLQPPVCLNWCLEPATLCPSSNASTSVSKPPTTRLIANKPKTARVRPDVNIRPEWSNRPTSEPQYHQTPLTNVVI